MKYLNFNRSIFVVLLFFLCKPISAIVEWKSVGMDTFNVNSLAVFHTSMPYFLVGTDKGYFYKGGDNKIELSGSESNVVHDITFGKNGCVYVAMSNNSDSDGVCWGMDIIDGEPFWMFRRGPLVKGASAVAVTGAINNPAVFVGYSTGIMGFIHIGAIIGLSEDSFKKIEVLVPDSCFGYIAPSCEALHIFSRDKRLYAGGYDKSLALKRGGLLCQFDTTKNSLSRLSTMNVTALTELFTETNGKELFVGTYDDGIYSFSDPFVKKIWNHFPSPKNEPIRHMTAIPTMLMSQQLCVAVNSGVYLRVKDKWYELGNIPAKPNCIVFSSASNTSSNSFLYAGTDKGIYRLDSLVTGVKDIETEKGFIEKVNMHYQSDKLYFKLQRSETIKIELVNSAGKIVFVLINAHLPAGEHIVSVAKNLSNGVYVIRMSVERQVYISKLIISR